MATSQIPSVLGMGVPGTEKESAHVAVALERQQDVMTATIDDGKANALTFEVLAELRTALGTSADAKVPLVIAGREGYFSAGFDLRIMRSGDWDRISALVEQGVLLFREMFAAPVPVLAACTGHALAAGALLLLAADYRIGEPGRYALGLNETRIGIPLPQFAIDMARLRLSTNRLIAATLFASIIGPQEALDYGYLDGIESDATTATRVLAGEMAAVGLTAFGQSKARMNAEIVRRLSEPLRLQQT
jgi:enoyl-CoA hydratase